MVFTRSAQGLIRFSCNHRSDLSKHLAKLILKRLCEHLYPKVSISWGLYICQYLLFSGCAAIRKGIFDGSDSPLWDMRFPFISKWFWNVYLPWVQCFALRSEKVPFFDRSDSICGMSFPAGHDFHWFSSFQHNFSERIMYFWWFWVDLMISGHFFIGLQAFACFLQNHQFCYTFTIGF